MASERQAENEPMARAVSAADVEKALAGIDFPKGKDEVVQYAASRLPPDSPVLDVIRKLPDGTYRTASDIAQGFGEEKQEEREERRGR
jgi:hypothetical protein